MKNTKDAVMEFSCLGDWVVGKNQYFAVANTKESRIDEKFRCFMKNRDDDYFLGQSITPECNQIKTVEQVSWSGHEYSHQPVKIVNNVNTRWLKSVHQNRV